MPKNQLNIYFIRHGESEANIKRDLAIKSEQSKLTPNGIAQAKALGENLKESNIQFNFLFSSTYTRALQTGQIVAEEIGFDPQKIQTSELLIEWNRGQVGKLTEEELSLDLSKNDLVKNPWKISPGGESLRQMQLRAATWLDQNIITNPDFGEDRVYNILVFSHGYFLKSLLQYILGFQDSYCEDIHLNYTSINRFIFSDGKWRLLKINDDSHLLDGFLDRSS